MAYQDRSDGGFERKMFQGDWKCAECGKEIKELPFEPDPNRLGELKCRDCHRKSRPQRNRF